MTDTGEDVPAAEEAADLEDTGPALLAVERLDASMTTRDGIRLDADVWMPQGDGPYPVLLMRTAFGRRRADTHVFAHPRWYAEQGYIVAVQDVRGTGTSQGTFQPFAQEAADGADAMAWAAGLAGSSGALGLCGCGYAGITQLLALAGLEGQEAPGDDIRAAVPVLAGWDLRDDWLSGGGAPRFAETLLWALQTGTDEARRAGDAGAAGRIEAALASWGGAAASTLADWARLPFVGDGPLGDWLTPSAAHGDVDRLSPHGRLRGRDCTMPTLHVGGWHDGKLAGTLAAYQEMAGHAVAGARQHLVVGPWTGEPWSRLAGTIDTAATGECPLDRLQLAWFDHWLKGIDQGLDDDDPVHLFDLGARRWTSFAAFPEPAPEALYLGSTGLAASTVDDGELVPDYPEETAIDRILNDPVHPVPAWAGHGGLPRGLRQRARIDARGDVAVYTTPAVDDPVVIAGAVELVLYAQSDAPGFDVSAVLSIVDRDGRVSELTRGYRRIAADEEGPHAVAMGHTYATLRAGQRLRLSLAGSSVPAFIGAAGGAGPALIEIASGAAGPSHLLVRTL